MDTNGYNINSFTRAYGFNDYTTLTNTMYFPYWKRNVPGEPTTTIYEYSFGDDPNTIDATNSVSTPYTYQGIYDFYGHLNENFGLLNTAGTEYWVKWRMLAVYLPEGTLIGSKYTNAQTKLTLLLPPDDTDYSSSSEQSLEDVGIGDRSLKAECTFDPISHKYNISIYIF